MYVTFDVRLLEQAFRWTLRVAYMTRKGTNHTINILFISMMDWRRSFNHWHGNRVSRTIQKISLWKEWRSSSFQCYFTQYTYLRRKLLDWYLTYLCWLRSTGYERGDDTLSQRDVDTWQCWLLKWRREYRLFTETGRRFIKNTSFCSWSHELNLESLFLACETSGSYL